MPPSSILVISALLAVAQGALMPRQSTGTARPGCFRCPPYGYSVVIYAEGSIQTNHDLLCKYINDGSYYDNCVWDGTTGAETTGSDPDCTFGPATPAAFQCPSAVGLLYLVFFQLDDAGNTECNYGPTGSLSDPIQATCQYDPTGEYNGGSPSPCPNNAKLCASTSRRAYQGDSNLAAVKRRQAARAPVSLIPRRLALGTKKQV